MGNKYSNSNFPDNVTGTDFFGGQYMGSKDKPQQFRLATWPAAVVLFSTSGPFMLSHTMLICYMGVVIRTYKSIVMLHMNV